MLKSKYIKYIFFIISFLYISCKAQTVPLNNTDTPNGAYEKDLNNILPFWEGTWEGINDNKEYTFQFVKFTHQLRTTLSGEYRYTDMLLIKFKVVDLLNNNQVLYDDLNNVDFEDYKITFLANLESKFEFYFLDSETNCYNNASFTMVKNSTNNNVIEYKNFKYEQIMYLDCPYQNRIDIPMFLPKVDLTLTRH